MSCSCHSCEVENHIHNHSHGDIGSVGEKKEIIELLILLLTFFASIFLLDYLKGVWHYIAIGFTILLYIVSGRKVLLNAGRNISKGKIFDENFLMAFASLAAIIIGSFSEGLAVMLFYRIGEYLQDLAVGKSERSIKALLEVRPDYANILKNGVEKRVSPEEVKVGDVVIVKPGEKVPLDGIILKGETSVDSRALTGESIPILLKQGERVLAGMVNMSSMIEFKVDKIFGESSVAKIMELVQKAKERKAKAETFITKFARYYTPIVFFLALAVAIIPPFLLSPFFEAIEPSLKVWVYRALVVLVVSCPCALIISVPLGYFAGLGAAARKGVLVKGASILETLSKINAVAFDKTGTLTKGVFKVADIQPHGLSANELLRYAAIAESGSSHPIAHSIVEAFTMKDDKNKEFIENLRLEEYKELAGYGIAVDILEDGKLHNILIGNDRMLHRFNISHSKDICSFKGSVAYVALDNKFIGYIVISDEVKDGVNKALDRLYRLGVHKSCVLTGDNEHATEKVLYGLKINEHYCNLLPEDKATQFERFVMQNKGAGNCLYVGDGINDAPVLAMADVGISMGGVGSDAAIEISDVVIMNDNIYSVAEAIYIAKRTKLIIIQNVIFALSIKALFIILGLFGVASMWEAVFGDVGVALLALMNSMRLIRK